MTGQARVEISEYGGAIRFHCEPCGIDEPRNRYATTLIEVRQHNRETHAHE